MAISIQTLTNQLSFSMSLSQTPLFLPNPTAAAGRPRPPPSLTILMGGGPRTYPGGVSKWQWKRMQANKAKQLLKARLSRERQIYEMRKRAELRAAASELERPWEAVEKAPNLLSVAADEQLKVLADRFQRPGGFDMWTDRDGPQIFRTVDDLPSARFFPKGVVHSVKPYRREPLPGGESSETSGSDRNRLELDLIKGSNVDKVSRNPNYGLRDNGYKRNVNSLALSDSEIGNVERNYFENKNSKGIIEQSNGYHEKLESLPSNNSEIENSDKFRGVRELNSNNSKGFRKNSYQNNSKEFRKNSYQRKLGSSGSNGLSFSDPESENFEDFRERQARASNSSCSNGFKRNGNYQRKFGSLDSRNGNLQGFEEKRALSSNNRNGFRDNSNYQRKLGTNGLSFSDPESKNFEDFGERQARASNSSYSNGFKRNGNYQRKFGSLDSRNGNLQGFEEKRALSSNNRNGFRNNSNYQRKFESSGDEFGNRGHRNNNRSYESRFGSRLRSRPENSSGNTGFPREQRNQNNNGPLDSESGALSMNENRSIGNNNSRSRIGDDRVRVGSKSRSFQRSESRYNYIGNGPKNNSQSEVLDMDRREDGSYGFQ